MQPSIWHTLWFKLTAAFLVVAIVGVSIVAVLANQATAVGFRQYVNQDEAAQWSGLQAELGRIYQQQGNWDGVETLLRTFHPGGGGGGMGLLVLDETNEIVASVGGLRQQPIDAAEADINLPILVDDQQVGRLLINGHNGLNRRSSEQFLSGVNRAIWFGGVAAIFLALILGIMLARRLTQPLRQLTQATHRVAAGILEQQVEVASQGELGELAASFNQMSTALAAAEKQRQQMLADIAHELRTPLSITQGHIEAMLDGVFETTPDNLALIHEETLLLGRLVEDLRTLSLAEAGQLSLNLQVVDLTELAAQTVAGFEPLAEAEGVKLAIEMPAFPIPITADADRIRQVLANLLSNALRHVRQGKAKMPAVSITLTTTNKTTKLQIKDNGPGLPPEASQHVFDRFWRADDARHRGNGGSGLGLAICRAIVEAHGGRIWVESELGNGAVFVLEMPAFPAVT